MGSAESSESRYSIHDGADTDARREQPRRTLSLPPGTARSPYQPQGDAVSYANMDEQAKEAAKKSTMIFAGMLFSLFQNPSNFEHLPYARRIALVESIRRISIATTSSPQAMYQTLIEVVMEGILTCDTVSAEEKNLIVTDGLLEQRWDNVFARFTISCNIFQLEEKPLDEFYSYRRMILALLKHSQKMQLLPLESQQRVRKMILKTNDEDTLNDLLNRILERTFGMDFQKKIRNDMNGCRFYRLVWPDRLDCEHPQVASAVPVVDAIDRKLPAKTTPLAYGSILLPDDLSHRQDCCPICLDPIQAPALELSCHHVFCSKCISIWITQQQKQNYPSEAANGEKSGVWYCPVCRQVHDTREH